MFKENTKHQKAKKIHIVEGVKQKNSKTSYSNWKLLGFNQYRYDYCTCNWVLKHNKYESMNQLSTDRPWPFRSMGFVRRFVTTGKVEIPEGVDREAELLYISDIVNLIKTHNIRKSMVLNLDQIPLKYAPCRNTT